MRIKFLIIFLMISPVLGEATAFAQGLFQNTTPPVGSNAPSYYYLGGQGGLTIVVNLWGFVKNPGRYEVPGSTDLVQLISLGGGPLEHAQLEGVKIVRQVLQSDSTYKTDVIPVDLQEFEKTGKKSPLLLPGDTVIVPGSTFTVLTEVLSLIGSVASILSGIGIFILYIRTKP